jgi:hypothetical protein
VISTVLRYLGALKRNRTNCRHLRVIERKYIEDDTPMVFVFCPDCAFVDHGPVHGASLDEWADEIKKGGAT